MAFHGQPEAPNLDAFTPIAPSPTPGALPAGTSSHYIGGLSSYRELVLYIYAAAGGANSVIEMQVFPSDDPTLPPSGEISYSQWFTNIIQGNSPAWWRIPVTFGTVRLINHGSSDVGFALYATQTVHDHVLQGAAGVVPRHFNYTGNLTANTPVTVPAADGLTGRLIMNGPATISVTTNKAISIALDLVFADAAGNPIAAPVSTAITTTTAINDIAIPGVPCYPSINPTTSVTGVIIDLVFIPNTPG